MSDRALLFDFLRHKLGPLSQQTVDEFNAVLDAYEAAGRIGPRSVSPEGVALVKQFEGCKLSAYPDPGTGGAPWTIGWGATGPGIIKGTVWTQAQADARLSQDLSAFAAKVSALLGAAPTTQRQFDALVSFAYNVGAEAFAKSTLLKLHRQGDYAGAAEQFGRWNRAGGRVLAGLTNRRAAEAELYRKGIGL